MGEKLKNLENFLTEILVYIVFKPFRIFALTVVGVCLMKIYGVNTVENVIIFVAGMIVLWNAREFYVKNDIEFVNAKLKELAKRNKTAGYFFNEGPKQKWTLQERLDFLEKMRK